MRTSGLWLKRIAKFGWILMMGASMSANAGLFGFGGTSWKEEVLLSDGKVIVVERKMVSEGGGDEWAFNRSGSKPKEYRIRFEYPTGSGKMIEWHSTKKSPRTWPEVPLVLDMASGQPIVFSLVAISAGCEVYSKYIYQNGAWIEEYLPEKFDPRATNLLFGSQKDLPTLLNLEEKNKRNSDSGYRREFKQIGPTRKVCG
jgi:hypothetical protein